LQLKLICIIFSLFRKWGDLIIRKSENFSRRVRDKKKKLFSNGNVDENIMYS
jgi:hypothetical protein